MTQTLTTTRSTAVAKYGDEEQIKFEMRALRQSLPGAAQMKDGKLIVSDELLRGLVIACKFSGLNPYRGEIYAIPGVGVMVASKIKAADAIAAAGARGDTLSISFETVRPGTPLWDANEKEYNLKPEDTVRVCQIISSKARAEYYRARNAKIDELRKIYGTGPEVGQLIEARLNEEFGNRPPVYIEIGVVKSTEWDGTEKKNQSNAYVAFTRADKADKRALQRLINKHGYAAADTRNYGGVTINEEPQPQTQTPGEVIDGAFRGAGTVTSDNEFPAASQVIEGDARPATNAPLRTVVQDLKSEEPFGSTPVKPVQQPLIVEEPQTRDEAPADLGSDVMSAATARWAKAATAAQKAKRANVIKPIGGITDPAAIEDIAKEIEAALGMEVATA